MCNALGSRTDPSRRSAFVHVASSFAEVLESPLANSVRSFPSATSSSVSQCTTLSVPPYSLGGTASVSGATCAMRIHSSRVVGVGSKRPLSRMAPACRGGNVSACAKFPEHAHFFHTVVLLIVIVGNSIRLASEVESDRARQRRAREACDLAPRAAQRFVAGDHCAWPYKYNA